MLEKIKITFITNESQFLNSELHVIILLNQNVTLHLISGSSNLFFP